MPHSDTHRLIGPDGFEVLPRTLLPEETNWVFIEISQLPIIDRGEGKIDVTFCGAKYSLLPSVFRCVIRPRS